MSGRKMHADEVETDVSLVRRLLAAQFPRWVDLPVEPVPSTGTDNAIYRLGDDMAVRLPRRAATSSQVEKEQRWLPRLAPHLPLTIPVPLALGSPAEGYPWQWSVYSWLEGETATIDRIADPRQAATDLAQFIAALQGIDPTGGPPTGAYNFGRGEPLAQRDGRTREAIQALRRRLDSEAVTAAWDAALRAPVWHDSPVWIHGDLSAANLLALGGRLRAVIDFGCLGVGDPAVELMVAWTLFSGESREAFRTALAVDDATWMRGRGWALSCALIACPITGTPTPPLSQAPVTRSMRCSPSTGAAPDPAHSGAERHPYPAPGERVEQRAAPRTGPSPGKPDEPEARGERRGVPAHALDGPRTRSSEYANGRMIRAKAPVNQRSANSRTAPLPCGMHLLLSTR